MMCIMGIGGASLGSAIGYGILFNYLGPSLSVIGTIIGGIAGGLMGRKLGAKLHKKAYVAMNETFIKGVTYKIGEDPYAKSQSSVERVEKVEEETKQISESDQYKNALKDLGVDDSMTTEQIESAYDELIA